MLGLALATSPVGNAWRLFCPGKAAITAGSFCTRPLSSSRSRWYGWGSPCVIPLRENSKTAKRIDNSLNDYISKQGSTDAERLLLRAARETHVDAGQLGELLRLGDILLAENEMYNLTAIRRRGAVLIKHIVDALSLLAVMDKENPMTVIDVGCGAGFPGIVLAIARPSWQVMLLDSVRKKTRFHEIVRSELGLQNIQSLCARAEVAGQQSEHRERYNIAVSRSVGEMRELCELCLPLVSVGGCFFAQKSMSCCRSELRGAESAIRATGGRLESASRAWDDEYMRSIAESGEDPKVYSKVIVAVRKASRTPTKYPRRPGVPKRAPL